MYSILYSVVKFIITGNVSRSLITCELPFVLLFSDLKFIDVFFQAK